MNNLCLLSIKRTKAYVSTYQVSCRFYGDEIKTFKNPDVTSLERGTGGRSSFNGNVVTVFGATGFLGRHICNQLGKCGSQMIIPYRCDPDDITLKHLKLCGDLGQVLFQPFDLRDPISIQKAVKYSNIVINLIGCNYETRNFDYHAVHVTGAAEIAKACREHNVERLIHFSALNLTENPKKYYVKKLNFYPSKLKGEEAVFKEFPMATVFRPSVIYGASDKFLWPLCNSIRLRFKSIPLYACGKKTIKQPVFASDVAEGVMNAINDYETRGKIYQAVGPERYYLHDIAYFCAQLLQRPGDKLIHELRLDPFYFAKVILFRYFLGALFVKPYYQLCFEHVELESTSDVVDKNLPTLEDLGVRLSKLEYKISHLVFPLFLYQADVPRKLKDYRPVDSLSLKKVDDFDF